MLQQLSQVLQLPQTDKSVQMVAELEGLVRTAELAAQALAQMTEKATKADNFNAEVATTLIHQVDIGVSDVNAKITASRQFLQTKRLDMEADKSAQQTNVIRQELAKMAQRVQVAGQSAVQTAQVARERAAAKSPAAAAQQPQQQQRPPLQPVLPLTEQDQAAFKRSDQDADGFLSRPELLAYCRAELRFDLGQVAGLCDEVLAKLVVQGEAGLRLEQLPRLKAVLAASQQQRPPQGVPAAAAGPAGVPAPVQGGLPRPPG